MARALALLVLLAAAGGSSATSYVIRASPTFQRLGDWRIDRLPR